MNTDLGTITEVAAENISLLMKANGHSNQFLSSKIGLAAKTVNNAQTGRFVPTVETIDAIAKFYDLEAWQLLVPGMIDESGSVRKVQVLSELRGIINDHNNPKALDIIMSTIDLYAQGRNR